MILLSLTLTALALAVPPANDAAIARVQGPLYPLQTCVISGEPLKNPVDVVADGKLFKVCCNSCAKEVPAMAAELKPRLEEAAREAQRPLYPLKTCAVSGKPLGDDAVEVVVQGRLVRLHSQAEAKALRDNANKVKKTLDEAYRAAQRESYPAHPCPVCNKDQGRDAREVMYGNMMVRVCSQRCVPAFQKDPARNIRPVLATLRARRQAFSAEGQAAAERVAAQRVANQRAQNARGEGQERGGERGGRDGGEADSGRGGRGGQAGGRGGDAGGRGGESGGSRGGGRSGGSAEEDRGGSRGGASSGGGRGGSGGGRSGGSSSGGGRGGSGGGRGGRGG